MKDELNYKVHVEPAMFNILNQIGRDVAGLGISEDDFIRSLWVYTQTKLDENEPPQWLWTELDRRVQEAEASNTVEGEVGL